METLTWDQRPNLIKKRSNAKSFSNQSVEPESLHLVIEAARRTPSYMNEQPWNFIIITNGDADNYQNLLECLAETNITLARHAPVLMLAVARLNFENDGGRNNYAFRDLAQAVSNLASRAGVLGLQTHQMAGFDAAMARSRFQIPDGHDPVAVIALGYPMGGPSWQPDQQQREEPSDLRRSIESMAFAGKWGQPATLPSPKLQPCP